jgi:hypothetical protein
MDVFSVWSDPRLYNEKPTVTDSSGKYKRLKLGGGLDMICSVKPVLTEDLCVVWKEEVFNNMLYM